jgi:hypothetical protein
MTMNGMFKKLLPLILLLAAALSRFWLASMQTRLPSDYAVELAFDAEDRFRDRPVGEWNATKLTARGIQQALAVSGGTVLIQSELHWYGENDEIIFESAGLYGVERGTRANDPTYGDQPRAGQFLFPASVEMTGYVLWDAQYVGPRDATFERLETLDGLTVYIFSFRVRALDETAGYAVLPGVPESYRAHTDGGGTFWVEPVSGITVDYEETGVSYFVDAANGERIAEFHEWSARYAPETRAAQLASARSARLRILALKIWIPGALMIAAFLVLCASLRGGSERRRSNPNASEEIASAASLDSAALLQGRRLATLAPHAHHAVGAAPGRAGETDSRNL